MPTPAQFKAPFEFDCFYHLLFRSIDGILLFRNEKERLFFLQKFQRFTSVCFHCWAYCLLDNHAHLIIKVKKEEKIHQNILDTLVEERTKAMSHFLNNSSDNLLLLDEVIERQVNRFMVSYANTYNNATNRKGGVFQQPFRRIHIAEDAHLLQAIVYVHANAQKHYLVNDFRKHAYNSYNEILSFNSSFVDCESILLFFEGKEKFVKIHKEQTDYFYSKGWPSSKLEVD